MCGMFCLVFCDQTPLTTPASMAMSRVPRPVSQHRPPQCSICSYNQPRPETPVKVYHRHYSSRQVRVTMGVEHHHTNPFYLCLTCEALHLLYQEKVGLSVDCVSTSQLHNFHKPREPILFYSNPKMYRQSQLLVLFFWMESYTDRKLTSL